MESASPVFQAYGASHWAVLILTTLAACIFIGVARCYPEKARFQNIALVILLLTLYPANLLIGWKQGWLTRENALPCELCDFTAAAGIVALVTRKQRWAEIVWFWGVAGTLNGLLTPDLSEKFPSVGFIMFFTLHAGVVITAFYLVYGLRLKPRPGAVWRAFAWAQVYLIAASLVNLLAGTNYGYLREKPPQASLLDFLGPWPIYVLALEVLALVLFGLLYLPFIPRKKS